ncbi:B3 domain-containing protein LFL1 [Acorus calamus]|uniref:B3 domain-containing protein LFL1 n=1 Tax=Acorus calamus TaxID=4465 RepID=A0AAV9D8S9_ACOCL|nr:B3 domain-containing protein LFL1 [Acorus calamus]
MEEEAQEGQPNPPKEAEEMDLDFSLPPLDLHSFSSPPPPQYQEHQNQYQPIHPFFDTPKLARTKRFLARRRRRRTSPRSIRQHHIAPSSRQSPTQAPPRLPDPSSVLTINGDRRVRLVVKKELRKSDVSPLGRIVLPKREAEANLPYLSAKEGIQLWVREMNSSNLWKMRYRFWPNNKTRMYVLENVGDFVRNNGLGCGDHVFLYKDEENCFYIGYRKLEPTEAMMGGLCGSLLVQEDLMCFPSLAMQGFDGCELGELNECDLSLYDVELNVDNGGGNAV